MKRVQLTSEWVENWKPAHTQEVADRGTKGLTLRGGPTGAKVFHTWGSERDDTGKRRRIRLRLGEWPALSLASARKMVNERREGTGRATYGAKVGDLLDAFIERGQVSDYLAKLLRKHIGDVADRLAATLPADVLPDLVAKVQKGYADDKGKRVGGPAVADKVRSGLVSLFAWAQRQGKFPADRALPTGGLVRSDFRGIGWKERDRVPSERELHQLFDALGIGTGPEITIDEEVSKRIPLASRLAVLLLMHVPVRSGVGLLAQPADAAATTDKMLRWATRKGQRDDTLETPLSTIAVQIVERLRALPGGKLWLVPSPEAPEPGEPWQHIELKALARMFHRLQARGPDGEAPRVQNDKGQEPFVPHTLRALWSSLAGELGVDDGVSVRVIGHKPQGASEAHKFYDHSRRVDRQREAVERVSAELERIRRREPANAAKVTPMDNARAAR